MATSLCTIKTLLLCFQHSSALVYLLSSCMTSTKSKEQGPYDFVLNIINLPPACRNLNTARTSDFDHFLKEVAVFRPPIFYLCAY